MGEQDEPLQTAHWTTLLDERELEQVRHAEAYAANHQKAGAPGHGQFLLIAKLAKLLDSQQCYQFGQGVR